MKVQSRKDGNNLFLSALLSQPWLAGFENRIEFQIDSTDIGEAFDDVIVVHLSNSSGVTNQDLTAVFAELLSDENRFKIAITGADAVTQCYVEIEDWTTAGQEAWLHVRVFVPVVGVTTFYLYYDRTAVDNLTYVGDIGSVPGQRVWTGDYRLVQHLYSASAVIDSTGRGNNGTLNSAPTLQDGQIGECLDFDGGDDYINFPHAVCPDLDFKPDTDEFTLGVWGKWVSDVSTLFAKAGGAPLWLYQYMIFVQSDGDVDVRIGGTQETLEGEGHFADNEWHHIVVRNYDDSGTKKFRIYIDGAAVGVGGVSGSSINNYDTIIGGRRRFDNTDYFSLFNGMIDEVQVLAGAWSPARIRAMFLSQTDNLITYI